MNGFSERNIDYGNLWRLLKQRRWKEANEETLLKLLEASGRIESMLAAGILSHEGMAILFQLFDTSGRLKMLESLARSERLVESEVKALLNLLADPVDREFHLYRAIETSEKLTVEEKKFLQRLIDLPSFSKPEPKARPTRQELFKLFLLGWKEHDWHLIRGDIDLCPCRDLQTIDSFWYILSGGRFGFSVQTQIWAIVFENIHPADRDAYGQGVEDFGEIVGWRRNNIWIDYDSVIFAWSPETTFSIENARYGHLPFFPRMGWWHWVGGMEAIVNRLNCCNCDSEEGLFNGYGTNIDRLEYYRTESGTLNDRKILADRANTCSCRSEESLPTNRNMFPSTFSHLRQPAIRMSTCSNPFAHFKSELPNGTSNRDKFSKDL